MENKTNQNISYERITSLLVESIENVLYGPDSKDGHEPTKEETELQLKKAEAVSSLAKAAMDVRSAEMNERRLGLDVVKTLLDQGYTFEEVKESGIVSGVLLIGSDSGK